MSEVVPIIYAPPVRPMRLSLYERLIALAVASACIGLMATSLHLHPSADGTGTHQELGFLPCTMLLTTGIPCPSCGMTTSFSWFFRGDLVASFWVQPAGFVLAWLTGILLVYSLYEAITARPIHRLLRFAPMRLLVIVAMGMLAFGWGWKIIIHLWGIDGWKAAMGS